MERATTTRGTGNVAQRMMHAIASATECARCLKPRTPAQRYVLFGDDAVCASCNDHDDLNRRVSGRSVRSRSATTHNATRLAQLEAAEAWLRTRRR